MWRQLSPRIEGNSMRENYANHIPTLSATHLHIDTCYAFTTHNVPDWLTSSTDDSPLTRDGTPG